MALDIPTAGRRWRSLEKRGQINRIGFAAGILSFLTIVTLPIVLPYLWLLVKSFTVANNALSQQVLWRASALAGVLYLGAIGITLAADRIRHRTVAWVALLAVVAILAVLLLLPHLSIENYRFLWTRDVEGTGTSNVNLMPSIWDAMGTSLILACTQTAIVIIVASPAAYALSRFAFAGREASLRALLLLHAFPALALTVAIFVQLHFMGLLNNITGVVLVMSALELPFAIFVLKGFFDAVPWDIEMSAVTDGASRFQAFRMIILPQIRGGLIAVATFSFLRGWEEYVFVRTLLIDQKHQTMSLYLFFVSQDNMGADYGMIAAVGIIYLLPVLLLYIFTQKYITQMNFGGIKG